MVVLALAVNEDPRLPSLAEIASGPSARTAVTTGWGARLRLATLGASTEDFGESKLLPRCITIRFPVDSQV